LAQSLRRAGFNVLFFHYRGAWGSQGDYSIGQQPNDVAAVLDYVRTNADAFRVNTRKLSIIGHSLGGFTAMRAAAADTDAGCVVGLAAANLGEWAESSEEEKQAFSAYSDRLFMLNNFTGAKALAELNEAPQDWDLRNLAPRFDGRSVLLITGDKDTDVPADVQARIAAVYEKTPGIKLTAEVIPGDHSFSGSRIRLQRMVIEWMDQNCR
jgi:alpha/beta superfamily hydrolase